MPREPQEVLPPSARGETATVARAAAAIVVVALVAIGVIRSGGPAAERDRTLLPFQVSFDSLPPALQREVREMHEGAAEAMRARGDSGKWPSASDLAGEGIPPFSGGRGGSRSWSTIAEPNGWQALGRSVRAGTTAEPAEGGTLLIRAFEPRPGDLEGVDPSVPLPPDEQHRRLADGTLLHVSFWMSASDPGDGHDAGEEIVWDPALAGYMQVVSGTRHDDFAALAPAPAPLEVGVTLHPYFSWTSNVVLGTDVEVRAVLPGDVDAGSYQPRPEDIAKLADLDAIVINGLGHDDFIEAMIQASGNSRLTTIRPGEEMPRLRGAHGEEVNSHAFLSFTNAIQQTYAIERALARLRPGHSGTFRANASAYARRLRRIAADASAALAGAPIPRVVTVHDGYAYLMQELGIEVAAVVEPAHGLVPSAGELAGMIDVMKRERLEVVFSEESFPAPLLETLRLETGAGVFVLSHVATGDYTAAKFEEEMKANADAIVAALAGESGEPGEPGEPGESEERGAR